MSNTIATPLNIQIGHAQVSQRLSGCTVVLAPPEGSVAAVDVRGSAPGTRDTELLAPENLVERVHAIVLTGGSAFGLASATGVMQWLEEQGRGLDTGYGKVPIVPAAVLFDLLVVREGDTAQQRPSAETGYAACVAAAAANSQAQGNIGAGAGATVGKLFGVERSMRGGLGIATVQVGPWIVQAIIACNAVGDVIDPATNQVIAGLRSKDGQSLDDTQAALLRGERLTRVLPGTNTTIGVIATNALLTKGQAKRLAMSGHDGLARAVRPAHTPYDGDTLFAMATGQETASIDAMLLNVMAAEAVANAIVNGVRSATAVQTIHGDVKAAVSL